MGERTKKIPSASYEELENRRMSLSSSFPLHPCLGSVLGIAGMGTRGKIGAVVVSSGPTARSTVTSGRPFLLASCPVESEDDRDEPKKQEGVWM